MPNSLKTPRPEPDKDDSSAVPIETIHTDDPVQRAILKLLARIIRDVTNIQSQLGQGAGILEDVQHLPTEVAVMKEQVATLKSIVYGGVAVIMLGGASVAGAAIVFFLRMGHT